MSCNTVVKDMTLMVIDIFYESQIFRRKTNFQKKQTNKQTTFLDYSRLCKWLNENGNLLLDTLTSSDTLKTPDFTKLSSRYTEKKTQYHNQCNKKINK